MKKHNLPWTEKYRAQCLDDLFLPTIVKTKISNIIETKDIPNLIMTGSSGTGKSCTANIIAKDIYGDYYDDVVYELGILDDKGIKFIQNDIIGFCRTVMPYKKKDVNSFPKYKLIIFDDSDNIISRVQDQICNIMENYSAYVRFIFTCNSSSEICESIQTKCIIWRFISLSDKLITDRLIDICKIENIDYTDCGISNICEISQGDMRSAISKLEIVSIKHAEINDIFVKQLFSTPQEIIIVDLFKIIMQLNLKEALKTILNLKKNSYSCSDIISGMFNVIKSKKCDFINENLKFEIMNKICKGIYNISNIDSDLQISGCIVDIIQCVRDYKS